MSFTEVMKNAENRRLGKIDTLFTRTAQIFDTLGADPIENCHVIVSQACTLLKGNFSVYLDISGSQSTIISGLNLPQGLDELITSGRSCLTRQHHEKNIVIIEPGVDNDVVLANQFNLKSLIGAKVSTGEKQSDILWIAYTRPRSFSPDQVNALKCLAGIIGCQNYRDQENETRQMGLVAGKIAHELNNILAGLVSYPELMLMQVEKNSPIKDGISFIHESGLTASELVRDFLFLTRPDTHPSQGTDTASTVHAYFQGLSLRQLEDRYPKIRFSLITDRYIPRIGLNELLLTKIVAILMAHAAQNTDLRGKVELTLSCTNGQDILIKVDDDGRPIQVHHHHRIFEPFYAKKEMGRDDSGLGLTLVKSIVERNQGSITLYSKSSGGNTIEAIIPSLLPE